MEHPGAVCVEFGELHGTKLKKALQCKAFLWRRWKMNLTTKAFINQVFAQSL
jgi:hypothetical protein